ncbi:diacylglycerol kinase family protein [Desertibacillus haloalkaliphilus]|uniref:diacylglycerol kinase family protein n=1 Tax=Desertibacillus haloalkaliphilus TaxID=1328930 RepID=UPI001C253675|nr:diacylglycerol kinase family protein [Desertibacillus haloalkaliphilus]MBU8905668.1 diacylglycerol kinase family protein [Desertibacillus haloalkaliphilus]
MGLKDKRRSGWGRLLRSFVYASSGLKYVIVNEQNMQIHLLISTVVILLSYVLSIPIIEQLILIVVIGVVIALEVMNTAIERVVDLVTEEYHPLAELAKDLSAAAVFVFSIVAVIIGIIVFYQPMIEWFSRL